MSITGMWSKPRLSVASPVRIRRAGMISLLFLRLNPLTLSQEKLPPSVETQMAAGVQALKSGDLDTAEKVFSDALRHGVKHPLVFHNLGVIAQQRGLHHQAIVRFREAILLQPDFGPTRLLLGSSLLVVGKNSEAIHELRRAVSLMPEQPEAHLQLARAYEGAENWIGVAREVQKLVELNPQEPEYHYRLGKAWTKVSQQSYQQIGRLNPDAARLHQALGQEYVIQEKYDLALDAYQQAVRSDPRLPEIHLAMAVILLELKKFDEALAQIELELKLVPESKAAAEIKAKIEAAKGAVPR
jgi:tetratricopeptide (TPR) repeat protein